MKVVFNLIPIARQVFVGLFDAVQYIFGFNVIVSLIHLVPKMKFSLNY